jgi:hypothetical protein
MSRTSALSGLAELARRLNPREKRSSQSLSKTCRTAGQAFRQVSSIRHARSLFSIGSLSSSVARSLCPKQRKTRARALVIDPQAQLA